MKKLFGTDGIRGVANEYPMTAEMGLRIGRALASYFARDERKIIIGKDTRISGYMLEYALAAGICSMGVDVWFGGILPTPAIAFLAKHLNASAGIVISASHNPFYDNGIKIFQKDGFKLSDEKEVRIEELIMENHADDAKEPIYRTGMGLELNEGETEYVRFLKRCLDETFTMKDLKVVLDCANGATFRIAPRIFEELGAECEILFTSPDGTNINDNCGSQHPQGLSERVVQSGADIGLAFDGDGDRLIAVDEKGRIVTGDQMMAILAKSMKQKKSLRNNCLVTTVMSNLGLRMALKEMDVDYIVADVGDRYVLEAMIAKGAVLGGEDSGHMIFLNHHTTGDGILSALKLVETMLEAQKPLSELRNTMHVFPQVLINVEVREKPNIMLIPEIKEAIESVEKQLGEKGRVLVRYSGTQPLLRVMAEGPTLDETRGHCRFIADAVRNTIGN